MSPIHLSIDPAGSMAHGCSRRSAFGLMHTNVRYWSDSSGWTTDGERYTGSGHDTWTHVSIYRSTALEDHGILAGWTATGRP